MEGTFGGYLRDAAYSLRFLKGRPAAILVIGALVFLSPVPVQAALLVSSSESDQILIYDQDNGDYLGVFASVSAPDGIVCVGNDSVWVASQTLGQVLHFPSIAGGSPDATINGFYRPIPMALGPDGNLYVGDDTGNGRINRYTAAGVFIDTFVSASDIDGLHFPRGLAFGPDGDLYVSSAKNNAILRYDGSTGAYEGVFASSELSSPHGLVFDANGDLYVANYYGGNVIHYNSAGTVVRTLSGGASGYTVGLAFGPDHNLYVSSRDPGTGDGSIKRFDPVTGAYIDDFVPARLGGLVNPSYFSFSVIPEPSTLILLAVSATGLRVRRRTGCGTQTR